jgi:4-amino-4-deoxy-L-arabinose transferase-like glycosyltransferase
VRAVVGDPADCVARSRAIQTAIAISEKPAVSQRLALPLLAVLVFVAALIPRMAGRDTYVTLDEDNWLKRTAGFTYALWSGELRRTYQNGHPGVTTMWVGMLGLGQDQALQFSTRIRGQGLIGKVPGFEEAIVDARGAMAVATALLTAVTALLAGRLWGVGVGATTGLLLAVDPFSVALGQILHVDGLLTGFMAISALCLIWYWWERGSRWLLVAAGVSAGLAMLSKTPGVFMLPFGAAVGGLALLGGRAKFRRAVTGSLAFGVLTVVSYFAFWPALWLAPVEMIGRVVEFLRETGGQPHEGGSFFWLHRVADPGPLFYPVALAYRLGLGMCLGLLLFVVVFRSLNRKALVGLVLLFILGFGLMMTLGPKKFDRYVMPIVPMLAVLAALGVWKAGAWLGGRAGLAGVVGSVVAAGIAILLQAQNLVGSYPYYLAYYNPLLGGATGAAERVMVGYGEGLDQVADWLNARPNATSLWVGAHSFDILQPQIDGQGESLRDRVPSQADYIVLYRFQLQVGQSPRVIDQYLGRRDPLLVVQINGLDYAYVYPGPRLVGGAT